MSNIDNKRIFISINITLLTISDSRSFNDDKSGNLLLERIKKSNKVKAVSWGHVHTEYYETIGSVKLFSTPSTCYQVKEKPKNFIVDTESLPGYRRIVLNNDGSFNTRVVRIS